MLAKHIAISLRNKYCGEDCVGEIYHKVRHVAKVDFAPDEAKNTVERGDD